MKVIRGQVGQLQVEGSGAAFSCRLTLLESTGQSRTLSFTATAREALLEPGQTLEVKIARNPAGEEVVFCRNLTTGKVLVDRINYQATQITYWFLAGCLGLSIFGFVLLPLTVLGVLSWIFHHLF